MAALASGWVLLLAGGGSALAGEVYTCVDAYGRNLTSDRPIVDCLDREQRVLSQQGVTIRILTPSQTALEREQQEARRRQAALEQQRIRDAQRRDRNLLSRFPNKAAHDVARANALEQSQIGMKAASNRLATLAEEREQINQEMAFYKDDPTRMPASLRRALEDNNTSTTIQQQALAMQKAERDRINARFDEELTHLRELWATAGKTQAGAPSMN
jgi:hypothetical protein